MQHVFINANYSIGLVKLERIEIHKEPLSKKEAKERTSPQVDLAALFTTDNPHIPYVALSYHDVAERYALKVDVMQSGSVLRAKVQPEADLLRTTRNRMLSQWHRHLHIHEHEAGVDGHHRANQITAELMVEAVRVLPTPPAPLLALPHKVNTLLIEDGITLAMQGLLYPSTSFNKLSNCSTHDPLQFKAHFNDALNRDVVLDYNQVRAKLILAEPLLSDVAHRFNVTGAEIYEIQAGLIQTEQDALQYAANEVTLRRYWQKIDGDGKKVGQLPASVDNELQHADSALKIVRALGNSSRSVGPY
jgi:DNA-binding transcriptional regulator YdaS (Cro superfamily)